MGFHDRVHAGIFCPPLVCEIPRMYATSFWGVIDLLAILPSYLGLVFKGPK